MFVILILVGLIMVVLVALAVQFDRIRAGLEAALCRGPVSVACTDLLGIIAEFARRGLKSADHLASRVMLAQAAEMRLPKGEPWQPLSARQVIATTTPGFVWTAVQKIGPVAKVRVIDAFVDGMGLWEVRLLGAVGLSGTRPPEPLSNPDPVG